MNVEIFYMLLPLAFALHGLEWLLVPKDQTVRLTADAVRRFPFAGRRVASLQKVSRAGFAFVAAGELLLLLLLAAVFVCGFLWPLLAVFWGFSVRLAVCWLWGLLSRGYVPGLVTAVLLAPYALWGVENMVSRFPVSANFVLALGGVLFVFACLFVLLALARKVFGR